MASNSDKASNNTIIEEVSVPSSIDDYNIPCKIWKAAAVDDNTPKKAAAAVFIHGGIFSYGDCDSHPDVSRALVEKLNFTIITISFRCGKVAPHSTGKAIQDILDATNYFRKKMYVEDDDDNTIPFGVIGSSSGGYFAMYLAKQLQEKKVQLFDFCIPLCPVAHPYRRAAYLKDCIDGNATSNHHLEFVHTPEKAKYIYDAQLEYWETEDAMKEAGELLRMRASKIVIPPTLMILGAADKNVPIHVCEYIQSWATRTIIIADVGHEIQNVPPSEDSFQSYLWDIQQFINTLILTKKQ